MSAIAIRFWSSSVLSNKWALALSPAMVSCNLANACICSLGFAVESLNVLGRARNREEAGISAIFIDVSVHALSKMASML